jgi:hypothetical protein
MRRARGRPGARDCPRGRRAPARTPAARRGARVRSEPVSVETRQNPERPRRAHAPSRRITRRPAGAVTPGTLGAGPRFSELRARRSRPAAGSRNLDTSAVAATLPFVGPSLAMEFLRAADARQGRGAQRTILDVPAVLERPAFRRQILKRTSEPVIRQWFEATSTRSNAATSWRSSPGSRPKSTSTWDRAWLAGEPGDFPGAATTSRVQICAFNHGSRGRPDARGEDRWLPRSTTPHSISGVSQPGCGITARGFAVRSVAS